MKRLILILLVTLPLLAAGSEVLWEGGSGLGEGISPEVTTTQILQMEQET